MVGLRTWARRVAAAVCCAVLPVTACSGSGIAVGSALAGYVPGGLIAFDNAKAGGRYGVAFPILRNRTGSPVTVDRVRMLHVPAGVRVIGYRALKVGGPATVYNSYEGAGDRADYLRYPNLFRKPYTRIPPHSRQRIFFAADLRVLKLTKAHISGCEIIYTTRGQTQQQTFDCEYAVYDP